MRENVFQMLDRQYVEAYHEWSLADPEVKEELAGRIRLLEDLRLFVYGFTWLKQKNAIIRLRSLIKHRFNYQLAADELGVRVEQLHKSFSFAQQKVREILKPVLSALESEDIELAFVSLRWVREGQVVNNRFTNLITDRFAPKCDSDIKLSGCNVELKVLFLLSARNINRMFSKISKENIEHLLYVLGTEDAGYAGEQSLITAYLEEQLTLDECVDQLYRYRDQMLE